jgi:hypothetical protein
MKFFSPNDPWFVSPPQDSVSTSSALPEPPPEKDAVDLASVRDDLAGVVYQALEPAHLSVWISQHN